MIASLPHSLWCMGSETSQGLTVWHPFPGSPPPLAQMVTDLERWVNEGGHGDDPDDGTPSDLRPDSSSVGPR